MMATGELGALAALRFNTVIAADDVWRPSLFHVRALHLNIAQAVLDGVAEATESSGSSPIGLVIQGQRGTGKTHLLGWVREKVQGDGGYFFLVSLLDARTFWESVVVSLLDGLSRELDGESQLKMFLRRLSQMVGVPRMVRREVIGDGPLSVEALDTFIEALWHFDRRVGREGQDTARALVLCASTDLNVQAIGDSFLGSQPEGEPGERAKWGIRQGQKSPQEIVRDLSRLLALTGPSIIAVDQIDSLIAKATLTDDQGKIDWREALEIEQVAHGLMALREMTRRTLTVLSCIPATWVLIEKYATDTVQDRFRKPVHLKTIPDADTGRALVEKRLGEQFRAAGFRPPYPTWPVKPSALDDAPGFTPRQLLIKIDSHIRSCRLSGEVTELASFITPESVEPDDPSRVEPVGREDELAALDARFAQLRDAADISAAIDAATEDAVMPGLLSAGLTAWIAEQGEAGRAFTQDAPPSAKPPLHARLRRSLDEATEDEEHWSFRAIASGNAIAALHRVRSASVAAGLNAEVPKRRLFLLRRTPWSPGAKTQETIAAFERAGGRTLPIAEGDLKVLSALRVLLAENLPHLHAWLADRRPVRQVTVLSEALGDALAVPAGQGSERSPGTGENAAERAKPEAGGGLREGGEIAPPVVATPGAGPYIPVGVAITDGATVSVGLEALRKHTAIFAGSGSGKTVLIRRLVEECALQGVSAIVLDPNNDLARLGDRWPEAPAQWTAEDAAKAEDYFANTDVVVWTPRREGGRPLSFQPLPDFGSVLDDADEFGEAVDAAVASIAPRVKLLANTHKAHLGLAVLREAVRHYGRRRGTGLKGLVELLSSLPEGVSRLDNAEKIAADLAQLLTAAMVNDPLFGGAGTPVDPGLLLTPPAGKRARVSVISFVGLQSDSQRQSFVNQLQMALFAWIKRHPAGDRPLGGLFVMDEAQTFAPSGGMTACTQSTLALASQARKYGLGLVFATQAPKGLHNRIPGNAATQFFGLLNVPVQIEAAKEMARAKGSAIADIGKLSTGQFYAAAEGAAFRKMQAPLCLSHHPKSPLTTEEVIERAKISL